MWSARKLRVDSLATAGRVSDVTAERVAQAGGLGPFLGRLGGRVERHRSGSHSTFSPVGSPLSRAG